MSRSASTTAGSIAPGAEAPGSQIAALPGRFSLVAVSHFPSRGSGMETQVRPSVVVLHNR
jgi:hypothetical protein